MTAAVSHSPEPYEVPEGGLASFLTATVGDWSDEALNADNYYDIVKPTAEQLAAFGREEDDRIVHVATGETVIPMAVFEEDPALKEALFSRMREMGIEPERYVVGNELNSINPVTGQPEFFLKKIFKGIKKAVKGVVKVFKKIAPIVLSIGGAMLFGPLGAALGSGIGTLIQGGNLKDAFKSALISGVTAGVTQGISQGFESAGALGEGATFGEKLSAGLEGFGQSIGEGIGVVEGTSYLDQLSGAQGIMNPMGREAPAEIVNKNVAMERVVPPEGMTPAQIKANAAGTAKSKFSPDFGSAKARFGGTDVATTTAESAFNPDFGSAKARFGGTDVATTTAESAFNPDFGSAKARFSDTAPAGAPATTAADAQLTAATPEQVAAQASRGSALAKDLSPGFFKSLKTAITQRDFGALVDAFLPGEITPEKVMEWFKNTRNLTLSLEDAALIAEKASPGVFAKYTPLMGLGIAGLAATGGFEQPEMEPIGDMYPFNRESVPFPFAPPGSGYKPLAAAKGGDIQSFPRKNGPIYGPGTETSDDIPAMLSDGEFVMTAKAVRGAGNGSRQAGMRKMYDMMRTFERSV